MDRALVPTTIATLILLTCSEPLADGQTLEPEFEVSG